MRGHKRKINSPVECGVATEGDVRPPARQCVECGARDTPQWREGPKGPKTLCNACGVKRLRLIRKGVTAAQSPLAAPIVRPPSQRQSQKAHRQQQKEQQQQHHDAVPGDHHGSDDSSGELDYSISGGHWNEAPRPQRTARQYHAAASAAADLHQAPHDPAPQQPQPAAGCQPLQQAGDVRDAALNLLSMASLQRPRTSSGAPSTSMPAQPAAAAHSSNPRKRAAEAPAEVTYLQPRVSRRRRRLEPDCGAVAMPAARDGDEEEDEEMEDESEMETQEIIIHPDPELSRLRHLQGKAQEACHELNAANAACTAVAKILLEKQAAAARAKEQAERFVALLHEEMRALSAKLPLSTVARASASATAVAESAAAAAAAAAERQQQQPVIVAPSEVPLLPLPLFT